MTVRFRNVGRPGGATRQLTSCQLPVRAAFSIEQSFEVDILSKSKKSERAAGAPNVPLRKVISPLVTR